jgi:hypothetical protein
MKWSNTVARMSRFLETDWHAKFVASVKLAGGVPRLHSGVKERCVHLGRCTDLDPSNQYEQARQKAVLNKS